MDSDKRFSIDSRSVGIPLMLTLVIWLIYWIEVRFFLDLAFLGVRPRTLQGLVGVVASPFVHGSLNHLWGNSLPLLVLSFTLLYVYGRKGANVLFLGWLITGFMTWLIAYQGRHIGASGVIYFLALYLFVNGIRDRHYRSVAISFLVVFLYGSLIWYVLPIVKGMSWEGHLSGAMTGVLMAIFKPLRFERSEQYPWEHDNYSDSNDPFLRHFDENGNWVDLTEEE
jgi:membrane associated rhomboid family serine protease